MAGSPRSEATDEDVRQEYAHLPQLQQPEHHLRQEAIEDTRKLKLKLVIFYSLTKKIEKRVHKL